VTAPISSLSVAEQDLVPLVQEALRQVDGLIVGKSRAVRLSMACLLARGHLLIEDLPGVGKTTLAHGLARALGLGFRRVQFTSDLLPADVVGMSVYQPDTHEFRFHPGPVFTELLLADELNRATPKTQGALLEAMEEHQVTCDGVTHRLAEPFFVIATQNPRHQIGTYPLPESQLDRFLMRIDMGYPDRDSERQLLKGRDRRELVGEMVPVLDGEKLIRLQAQAAAIHVADALLDYIQDLVAETRRSSRFTHGLSPRAGLGLLAVAKAWALLEGRKMVLPEHVQAVARYVIAHRLVPAEGRGDSTVLIDELILATPVP